MNWFRRKTPSVEYLEVWEMETILQHFANFVGSSPIHYHDGNEDPVHIDLGHIATHKELGCQVVFTFGMSALPIPGAHIEAAYAELFMLLPHDWPKVTAETESEVSWPLHWLRTLAKKPFTVGKRVEPGSVVYFDDPIPNTTFSAFLYLAALLHSSEFGQLPLGERLVNFWMVVPITEGERRIVSKLNNPIDILDHVLRDEYEAERSLQFFIVTPGRDDFAQ